MLATDDLEEGPAVGEVRTVLQAELREPASAAAGSTTDPSNLNRPSRTEPMQTFFTRQCRQGPLTWGKPFVYCSSLSKQKLALTHPRPPPQPYPLGHNVIASLPAMHPVQEAWQSIPRKKP